ncbi:MAG: ATP-binding protein [Candidatus Hermodarchaeota archaeon]
MQDNINILVVDEDKAFLNRLKNYLEEKSENLTITTIFSPYDVLELLKSHNYDVIVTTHEMSGLTGLEILAELRRGGDSTPFIILIDNKQEGVVIEVLNQGVDYHLKKEGEHKNLFQELFCIIKLVVNRERKNQEIIKNLNNRLKEIENKQVPMKNDQKFRHIFEQSVDGIVLADEQGIIIEWNQGFERLTGLKRADVIGKPLWDVQIQFLTEEQKEKGRIDALKASINGFFRTGAASWLDQPREIDLRHPDGKLSSVQQLTFAIKTEKGTMLCSIIRDITERRQTEEKLRRTSAIVGELNESLKVINSILRHDILNDLAVIRGYLDLFKDVRDIELLERAYEPITKIAELINRMRELEHLITSDKALQAYNARQIVETVLKDYAASTVEFNVEGEGTVLVDLALSSVIDNLVRNALIHTDTEQVDIKIEEQDSFCEIRVIDYGSGIPDKIKAKIFEPGFKHGKKGHMGLGLYIVKKIIERYEGEVTVEDNYFALKNKKGKGTTFVLKLKRP